MIEPTESRRAHPSAESRPFGAAQRLIAPIVVPDIIAGHLVLLDEDA